VFVLRKHSAWAVCSSYRAPPGSKPLAVGNQPSTLGRRQKRYLSAAKISALSIFGQPASRCWCQGCGGDEIGFCDLRVVSSVNLSMAGPTQKRARRRKGLPIVQGTLWEGVVFMVGFGQSARALFVYVRR
jgi:hypothetical protein